MRHIFILLAQVVLFCNCQIKIESIGTVKTRVGEGPFYDSTTDSLYYTDIIGRDQILRYDLHENQTYKAHIVGETDQMGFIMPVEGRKNEFGVGIGNKLKIVRWDGKSTQAETLGTQLVLGPSTNVAHDSLVDPSENLFAGTVRKVLCNPNSTEPAGGLHRSNNGQRVTQLVSAMNAPNDFAIDEIRNVFYLIDSCNKHIRVYDWQPVTGILSNERFLVDLSAHPIPGAATPFAPDGMALDTDGNIFVTMNGAGFIYKIDPTTSTVVQRIEVPGVRTLQTLTFGGKNLDILFVTTTGTPFSLLTGRPYVDVIAPGAIGLLHKITGLGVKGRLQKKLPQKFATIPYTYKLFIETLSAQVNIF